MASTPCVLIAVQSAALRLQHFVGRKTMNAAKLDKSDRLQRVDALLSSGKQYSTLEIVQKACVCAVNSIIAELRANGRQITCKRFGSAWYYWMEV